MVLKTYSCKEVEAILEMLMQTLLLLFLHNQLDVRTN